MRMLTKKHPGFTIDELLIVIVVIAILAAISIVAYRGVQSRANDSVVQNDISGFAKKILLYKAEYDTYPTPTNDKISIVGMDKFSLAKSSYSTSVYNFIYCTGDVGGAPAFAVGAVSKSGSRYFYSSLTGTVQTYAGAWGSNVQICPGMLPGMASWDYAYAYDISTGWRPFFN